MGEKWKKAKAELRAIGVGVNTSVKGCCLGCVENSPFTDEAPAIYQLSKRWSGQDGGFLCHQNLGGTLLALEVMAILENNRINWHWDGSQSKAIELDLEYGKE
jgi:hypothetical protein